MLSTFHCISRLVELTFIGLHNTIDLSCGNRTVKFIKALLWENIKENFNLFFKNFSRLSVVGISPVCD